MNISKLEFEILVFFAEKRKETFEIDDVASEINESFNDIDNCLKELKERGFISSKDKLEINEKGLEALEPYRVKKAFILAAGFGSRMVPVTLDRPKPLVRVNGKRIVETMIEALISKDIKDITIVRGYKKECFEELVKDYPFIKLVDNDEYDVTNSISSLEKVIDDIGECYICESDFYVTNPNIISKYNYSTNYLGAYVGETDDWCLDLDNGYVKNYRKGGKSCYISYCVSYWTKEDAERLKEDIKNQYKDEEGRNIFWEAVPLTLCHDNYKIEIKECRKEDILEIDTFDELVAIDPSYKGYKSEE